MRDQLLAQPSDINNRVDSYQGYDNLHTGRSPGFIANLRFQIGLRLLLFLIYMKFPRGLMFIMGDSQVSVRRQSSKTAFPQ
jgi:hypothetical protein